MNEVEMLKEILAKLNNLEYRLDEIERMVQTKNYYDGKMDMRKPLKYEALYEHLVTSKENSVTKTFSEIEELIGEKLPSSANKYPAFWANVENKGLSKYWIKAGFIAKDIDTTKGIVNFYRVNPIMDEGMVLSKKEQEIQEKDKYSTQAFFEEIQRRINEMTDNYIEIKAGKLHNDLNPNAGTKHRIPNCCGAMWKAMKGNTDTVIENGEPVKMEKLKPSSKLTIRYYKENHK